MNKHLLFSVLSATALMTLSSCSNSGGDVVPEAYVRTFDDKAGSCAYEYTEGGNAPSSLPAANIKNSLFAKPYDASLLQAVLPSSASEMVRFAGLTGVDFFQIANQGKVYGCGFSRSLAAPPSEVEKEFRDHEADIQKEYPNSILEGFYLDTDMVRELTGKSMRPLIVVKDDSEKAVMIHELMHHIYQLSKPNTGLQVQVNYSRSSRAFKTAVEAYSNAETDSNLANAISKLDKRTDDFIVVLKNYPLEEMANETEMSTAFRAGTLKYVDKHSRYGGDSYIVSSAQKAKDRIKDYKEIIPLLSERVDKMQDQAAKATAQATVIKIETNFKNLVAEIEITEMQARARLASMRRSSLISALVSEEKSLDHVGCAHSRGVDDTLKQIEKSIPVLDKNK